MVALSQNEKFEAGAVTQEVAGAGASIHIVFGLLLAICVAGSSLIYMSYISIGAICLYLVLLIRDAPRLVLKYFYFFFAVYANILGCALCELTDCYLRELMVFSAFVGSLPLLVFSRWLFLAAIVFLENARRIEPVGRRKPPSAIVRQWLNVANTVVLLICAVEFADVCYRPSFLLGLSRFEYAAAGIQNPILDSLGDYLQFFIVIPLVSIRDGNKRSGFISIALYLLYLLFVGNKFGAFLALFCVALLVYSDKLSLIHAYYLKRLLYSAFGIVLALAGLSVFMYTYVYTNHTADEYFTQRVAQQGQLWWRSYALLDGEMHPEEFANEIDALFNAPSGIADNVGSQYGIYKIMYFTAPANLIDSKLMTKSRYTEAGYAAALYYFGAPGALLFSMICAGISYILTNSLVSALSRRKLLSAVLLLRLYMILHTAISMFLFNKFLAPVSLASIAVVILLEFGFHPDVKEYSNSAGAGGIQHTDSRTHKSEARYTQVSRKRCISPSEAELPL